MARDPDAWRRRFVQGGAALALASALPVAAAAAVSAAADAWDAGDVVHLLPGVNHERVLLKVSLRRALSRPPQLRIGDRRIAGSRSDSDGRFWQFDVTGLQPDTRYVLQLHDQRGRPLCASWPLATLPAPDARPQRLRILMYTCAGGHPDMRGPGNVEAFRTLAVRHALLERGLSFRPDAVIANGDHIYWDQRTWLESGNQQVAQAAREFYGKVGLLDRGQPVYGSDNERALKAAVDPQIAQLYGVRLRSTPVFFLNDDHDYFENDEAEENFVTFPPDHFELQLARAVQHLYYPEFLPDATRPLMIPGSSAADRAPGVAECFGSLRYGRLLEVLLFDCGRYLSLKDRHAGLIPAEAEQWLLARTRADDTQHLIHMPSTPMLWTAGKWREWYPDVLVSDESLAEPGDTVIVRWAGVKGTNLRFSTEKRKYMWQSGWFAQHQRLLRAMSEDRRAAISMSGDLHATGWDRILRSGDLDLRANPINVVLNGPLGTSTAGWPSGPRGLPPAPASGLEVERRTRPMEKNGFSIVDITPDKVVCRLFAWREPDPVEAIASLEPYEVLEIPRRG